MDRPFIGSVNDWLHIASQVPLHRHTMNVPHEARVVSSVQREGIIILQQF